MKYMCFKKHLLKIALMFLSWWWDQVQSLFFSEMFGVFQIFLNKHILHLYEKGIYIKGNTVSLLLLINVIILADIACFMPSYTRAEQLMSAEVFLLQKSRKSSAEEMLNWTQPWCILSLQFIFVLGNVIRGTWRAKFWVRVSRLTIHVQLWIQEG